MSGVRRRKRGRIGVPKGTYELLAAVRGEICWCCEKEREEGKPRLHIDHDHKTLAIRGLLCFSCNWLLGRGRSAAWLRAAADYLDTGPGLAAAALEQGGKS